jgi:hypothetical protein
MRNLNINGIIHDYYFVLSRPNAAINLTSGDVKRPKVTMVLEVGHGCPANQDGSVHVFER